MTQKYFGLRGQHTITTDHATTQEQLLAAGFEEYPAVTGNPTLRFVDGEWRDVRVTRHYGRAGRFEQSAHLNEDEHDSFRVQGFEEYTRDRRRNSSNCTPPRMVERPGRLTYLPISN